MSVELSDPRSLPADTVLFDPEALAELLSREPDPGAAFVRFPRSLDSQIKRANAYRVPNINDGQDVELVLLRDSSVELDGLFEKAKEEPARLLRLPSGRLCAATDANKTADDEADLREPLAEVSPGLYRVRAVFGRTEFDSDLPEVAERRLCAEDLAVLKSATGRGWIHLLAISAATLIVLVLWGILHLNSAELELPRGNSSVPFILLWLGAYPAALFLIFKLHPTLRGARSRLDGEVEQMKVECKENWIPAMIVLTREGDDPGDPGVRAW